MRVFIPVGLIGLALGSTVEPEIDELDRLLVKMENDPFLGMFDQVGDVIDETSEESSLSSGPVTPASKRPRTNGVSKNMRTIVIEELLKDIQVHDEEIQGRMFTELPEDMWLSIEEISRMRYDVARPLVQPILVHNLLSAYPQPVSIEDPAFMAYMRENLSGRLVELYTPEILKRIVPIWMSMCINPLTVYNAWKANLRASAEPPCFLKEIVRLGVKKHAFVLSKKNQRLYLEQTLRSEREYLRSLDI